jgi:hypothetical protein
MIKLIRLEWKKYCISKYIRNALILTACLAFFIFANVFLGIANDPDTGVPDMAFSNMGVSSHVKLLTSISFLIFASVMHGTFTIGAYKNKTMNLMFSYPISRKKILVSKMLAVWIFNFIAIILAQIIIYECIQVGLLFFKPAFPMDVDLTSISFYMQMILKAAMTISVSLIALFIGSIMKSSKAAIIASFLLIILMQGNVGGATLADNVFLPVILTAISIGLAFLSILPVEKKDVN